MSVWHWQEEEEEAMRTTWMTLGRVRPPFRKPPLAPRSVLSLQRGRALFPALADTDRGRHRRETGLRLPRCGRGECSKVAIWSSTSLAAGGKQQLAQRQSQPREETRPRQQLGAQTAHEVQLAERKRTHLRARHLDGHS